MVAKIKSGKSLIGALNYNENKVKQGKAKLIEASGYPKDKDDLNFYDKLQRLTDLAEGN
jgi:ribosomal protein L30E